MSKLKGKYFVYLANTCTNSIVKRKWYFKVNILSTSLINLAVATSNAFQPKIAVTKSE